MAKGITMNRIAQLQRRTSESSIDLSINLDGTGRSEISTTVPFFDHLLTAFAKHSLVDLVVKATGDTHIDVHHTVEDTAIVLGQAIKQALGDKAKIGRYGDATVPLDDALARAVVDVSGRPYLVHTGEPAGFEFHLIGGHFTGSMIRHVFEAIAYNAGITVHVTVLDGRDPHHIAEAEFKAFAEKHPEMCENPPRFVRALPEGAQRYITSYQHAFGLQHVLGALVNVPVIIGTSWSDDMFTPDAAGFVHPGGQVQGGHEWCLIGLDVAHQFTWAQQSWGPSWGLGGLFKVSFADLGALLADGGDATVLVR